MQSLVFTDTANTFYIEYIISFIDANNFTVSESKIYNIDPLTLLSFNTLQYNLDSFINFAQLNKLQLKLVDYNLIQTVSTHVNYSKILSSIIQGIGYSKIGQTFNIV